MSYILTAIVNQRRKIKFDCSCVFDCLCSTVDLMNVGSILGHFSMIDNKILRKFPSNWTKLIIVQIAVFAVPAQFCGRILYWLCQALVCQNCYFNIKTKWFKLSCFNIEPGLQNLEFILCSIIAKHVGSAF